MKEKFYFLIFAIALGFIGQISNAQNVNPSIVNIVQNPQDYVQSDTQVSVSADITDSDGSIALVELHWGTASNELINTIAMSIGTGDTYTVNSSIPAQVNGVTVYYEVYAEDNDGGSTTSSLSNYQVAPLKYEELFDSDLGECYIYSVSGDTKLWNYNASLSNAQMNGFDSGELEEDWLILPSMNLTGEDLLLSFDSWRKDGVHDANNYLKLYYSTDYPGSGDPSSYTWTELSFTQPSADQVWTSSGDIELSGVVGSSVYFGFKYNYNVGNYAEWYIDNLKVAKRTYSVSFSVKDYTNPKNPVPIDGASVNFYSLDMQTDVLGEATRMWVEPANNLIYTITKTGYHDYQDTVDVFDQDLSENIQMLDERVAVNIDLPEVSIEANSAVVTWDGSGADKYLVLYIENETGNYETKTVTSNSATILVTQSTSYTVKVRTNINGKWSAYSDPAEFTSSAGTTVIAENIAVPIETITANSAVVTWDGSGADKYTVLYIENETGNYNTQTVAASPATIFTSPSTAYTVKVRTYMNGQWSSYSDPAVFTSSAGTTVIAENVDVPIATITANSAVVTWDGSGADKYIVLYIENETGNYSTRTVTASPATIFTSPSTAYTVKVRTYVNGQWSSFSDPAVFTSSAGSSVIAETITYNNVTSSSADISWTASGADKYMVLYINTSAGTYETTSTTSSALTISLEPETNYDVKVRTRNSGQWSDFSNTVNFTTSTASAPAAINNVGTSDDSKTKSDNKFKSPAGVVYPNPARDIIYMDVNMQENDPINISIFDLSGRMVQNYRHEDRLEQTIQMNIESLDAGIYIVKLRSKDYQETRKFIKK